MMGMMPRSSVLAWNGRRSAVSAAVRIMGGSAVAVKSFNSGRVALFEKSTPTNAAVSASGAPPAAYPHKSKSHGSYHWSIERGLSVVTLPLIGTAMLAGPIPAVDIALGIVIPIHTHIGFDVCIMDYIPARVYGPLNWLAHGALYVVTGVVLYGAYKFNTEDVGITRFVTQLWTGKVSSSEKK